jgi:cytochrome bd-type quinol oxidase subunit 2
MSLVLLIRVREYYYRKYKEAPQKTNIYVTVLKYSSFSSPFLLVLIFYKYLARVSPNFPLSFTEDYFTPNEVLC